MNEDELKIAIEKVAGPVLLEIKEKLGFDINSPLPGLVITAVYYIRNRECKCTKTDFCGCDYGEHGEESRCYRCWWLDCAKKAGFEL